MKNERFSVYHWAKLNTALDEASVTVHAMASGLREGFFLPIETCQRKLWIGFSSARAVEVDGIEHFEESEAYAFLLRVATGLESAVVGETDIFGQLKSAWSQFESHDSNVFLAKRLRPIFQKLFEDTKQIRTDYLQGIGGASYGSLVRRVIKPQETDQILILGAGKAARAVLPYVGTAGLRLWNRTAEHLESLLSSIKKGSLPASSRIERIIDESEEISAWRDATHVIVCVPPDSERDEARLSSWLAGKSQGVRKGKIVHLGCLKKESSFWRAVQETFGDLVALEDLFEMQAERGRLRERRIEDARAACEEKARARFVENAESSACLA